MSIVLQYLLYQKCANKHKLLKYSDLIIFDRFKRRVFNVLHMRFEISSCQFHNNYRILHAFGQSW